MLVNEVSFRDTLSDKMTFVTVCRPAKPSPCRARPTSSIAQARAPAASALPMRMNRMDAWRTECRPKTSEICPYRGIVDVDAKVNAVTTQLNCASAAVRA